MALMKRRGNLFINFNRWAFLLHLKKSMAEEYAREFKY